MSRSLAQRQSALAVPTRQELEALGPGDRWTLEERLGDAQTLLREFNDDELRRWVEVEGKTQREIAKMVGRSPGRIAQRASRLGLKPRSNRGGSRLLTPKQSDPDEEVIDAEVVEEDPDLPTPTPDQEASIRRVEQAHGEQAGVDAAMTLGVQHPDDIEQQTPNSERVRCPTCGHMVKPEDFKRGV